MSVHQLDSIHEFSYRRMDDAIRNLDRCLELVGKLPPIQFVVSDCNRPLIERLMANISRAPSIGEGPLMLPLTESTLEAFCDMGIFKHTIIEQYHKLRLNIPNETILIFIHKDDMYWASVSRPLANPP